MAFSRGSGIAWMLLLPVLGTVAAGCGGEPGPPGIAPGAGPALVDVTAESGIHFRHDCGARGGWWLPEALGPGGALFDRDGDGDLDLYLVQGGPQDDLAAPTPTNRLFLNDGDGRFRDATEGSGADVGGYGMGCAAADYDRDGDVDLYVTRIGPNVLLRNDGDTFRDVTAETGVGDPGFGASAAFLDFDRDGQLDLYVVKYVDWAPHLEGACFGPDGRRDYCNPLEYEGPSVDRLYRGTGNGRFEDVTESAGIAAERGNGLGVICTDFDGDGWTDIYVANDQTPAFLWLNQGDGTFVEDAAIRGCGFSGDGLAIAGMGAVAGDLDADGDFDLVVTNICDQAHLALRNEDGFFLEATHDWGFAGWGVPYTGFGVALFDQDHDGTLEAFVANGGVNRRGDSFRADNPFAEPDQFLRRGADGRFFDAAAECGTTLDWYEMGRSVLVGDLDGDGDQDLVVTTNRGPVRVLRNDAPADRAWTQIDLRPADGGREALNARVEIKAGGMTRWSEVRPHSGYLGTNDVRIHAGFGEATSIERVTVTWPGGERETWTDLPVRVFLRLREGAAPAYETEPGDGAAR